MSPDLTCPHCVEAECRLVEGSHWYACPVCGHGYSLAQLADLAERKKRTESKREVISTLLHSTRRRAPGGGDDGLSMTWDIPIATHKVRLSDGSVVWLPNTDIVRVSNGSGQGPRSKKVEPRSERLSLRGLPPVSGEEVVRAIESALEEDI